MIMGQNLPYKLPDEIPANEFYLLEGRQFSKSEGWTIDLEDFFTKYTADQIRYSIAANAPETSDSEFSWKDFQKRCNAELLGKFGNFVHRVLVFAKQQTESRMPKKGSLQGADQEFAEQMNVLIETAALNFENFQLRKATQTLMELSHLGNAYFDARKPWALAKDPASRHELETCIALCIECIKNLSLLSSPIIPDSAQKIWEMIGFSSTLAKGSWTKIHATPVPVGQPLADPTPLFRKVEDAEIEEQVSKLKAMSVKKEQPVETISYEALKETIGFDQFDKVDLRVVQVLEAVKVPKSKKLLKLTVDLGFEKRTIVSGIALKYEPEQLIGKKVLLLANLAPATLMGIESQGMILAAGMGSELELPAIQHMPPGSTIS
jgi:methionyl-tRNA synthetase